MLMKTVLNNIEWSNAIIISICDWFYNTLTTCAHLASLVSGGVASLGISVPSESTFSGSGEYFLRFI